VICDISFIAGIIKTQFPVANRNFSATMRIPIFALPLCQAHQRYPSRDSVTTRFPWNRNLHIVQEFIVCKAVSNFVI